MSIKKTIKALQYLGVYGQRMDFARKGQKTLGKESVTWGRVGWVDKTRFRWIGGKNCRWEGKRKNTNHRN